MPVRRPRSRPAGDPTSVVLPLLAAAVLGLGLGLSLGVVSPTGLALGVGGVVVLLLVVLRLEWIALALVAASVFEDYLASVVPAATKGLAVLLVLAWVVRRSRGPLHGAARSPVMTAALAFTVALLASTAVHNNGSDGLTVTLRYVGFLAVLLVLAEVQRGGLAPVLLARAYVVACTLAAGCGLGAFAIGVDRRAGGPIGDPNDFAFYLLPAVALAVGLRATARRRWLCDLAVVVLVVAILATLSRGALLGLLALGLVAVLTGMVRLRAAAAITALVALAAGTVALAAPGVVSVSLQQKDVVAGRNVSERLQLWTAAAQMTADAPVLGLGPGSFAERHGDYLSIPDDVNHPLDVAHNTWLEISSELGLVGLVAFAALLTTAFAAAWSAWRRRGDPMGAAVAAGLVGCAVAATFVTEQYYLPLWLLCALAVGVSARPAREVVP